MWFGFLLALFGFDGGACVVVWVLLNLIGVMYLT
jgi:hypothetical protein